MNLLRFITAGSVDDGKSTLIGRLLYDSNAVLEDQLEAIKSSSRKNNDGSIDLAILTDGLKAEREQGITIDVAYKYFNTSKRKFIIIDAPGHIQYTRNMITGASNADLAIILVDARKGVIEQTRRHSFIASFLGIQKLVVCVNKMDLLNYAENAFDTIVKEYKSFAQNLRMEEIYFIPISALHGENITDRSEKMKWFKGASLLDHLENVDMHDHPAHQNPGRFNVQWVIRPQTEEYHDYRGYAGRISSGIFKKGDKITVHPSEINATIKKIETMDGELSEAFAPMSVTLHLSENIDVSRGNTISHQENQPEHGSEIEADICWMDHRALEPGGKYLLQHNSNRVKVLIREVRYKINFNSLEKEGESGVTSENTSIHMNDIARVIIRTSSPISADPYDKNRTNGAFILINEQSNLTCAAGMVQSLRLFCIPI